MGEIFFDQNIIHIYNHNEIFKWDDYSDNYLEGYDIFYLYSKFVFLK